MCKTYRRGKIIEPQGFFIEAGAGDGEVISNSLYFELKYGVSRYTLSNKKAAKYIRRTFRVQKIVL